MGKLQDKVAVITGGASGIGEETARLFVSEGAKVVLVDLNKEKGKALEKELKTLNAEALFVKVNITSEEDVAGVFLVAREAIREMLKTGGGTIVNTASMYGWVGSPGSRAYNAAKGGVINLTRSLALEYAEQNIRVNSLCPGFIDTPIIPEESKQVLASMTPMKRLGQAEEMAKAVLFMASEDSSFMTGNSLTVDGGYTAQ